jgi:C-terminal processing protease CtpA/Prc
MPILSRFVLTIDYVNGRLYAEPLASASLPFEDDATGAVLFSQGWDLKTIGVLRVIEGSAAATGGLQAGDTLVWIDDEPVFNLEATRRLFRKPGHQFRLMVLRRGEQVELTLTTRKR